MKSVHIQYDSKFVKQLNKLPSSIQQLALKKEKIFKSNPLTPSLKSHKLSGNMKGLYAFSVNYEYRIIFYFVNKQNNEVVFLKIGTHEVYK